MKPSLNNFFKRKMTRKEFLSYLEVFFLGFFGFSAITRSFLKLNIPQKNKVKTIARHSFGSGTYGI